MGLFDSIDYSCECPLCGEQLGGFQSKDGPCQMENLKPWEVSNFYTGCGSCGAWVEFVRKKNAPPVPARQAPPEPEDWEDHYGYLAEPGVRHRKYKQLLVTKDSKD